MLTNKVWTAFKSSKNIRFLMALTVISILTIITYFYYQHKIKINNYYINQKETSLDQPDSKLENYFLTTHKSDLLIELPENAKPKPNSLFSKWIVVTTINNPTKQIEQLSKINGFKLVVVGDKKTDRNWTFPNVVYLSVEEQQYCKYRSFQTTPLNSYTRKNIGYLYAIQHGAQHIYDTDDDNAPDYDLNEYFDIDKSTKYGLILDIERSDDIVVNPYAHFGQPTIWPRGYPLSKIHLNYKNNYLCGKLNVSIVQQGLVNGDPDVEAIFRLTKTMNYKKPNITFDSTSPSIQIPSNTFTPYNSQNTLFHYSAFWSMYLPKTVSFRLTDIWRSYWSQRLMWLIGGTISFYGPTATQLRNSHSYMKDYEEEQNMYTKTDALITFLSEWNCTKSTFFDCVIELSEKMADKGFWLHEEVDSIRAWLNDLLRIGYIPPIVINCTSIIKANKSNLMLPEYFKARYTPKFQKSMDLDNLCCADKNLISLYDRFSAFKFLNEFCFPNTTILPNKFSQSFADRNPIGNYALLVTFNWDPKPIVIKFIKHFYGEYFKLIVFCGKGIMNVLNEERGTKNQFDSYSFIELDTVQGYFHYYCMTKMIEIGFHVDGILLMSDDVMLKYWNIPKDLNFNKKWFSQKLQCNDEIRRDLVIHWMWWLTDMGVPTLLKMFGHIRSIINGSISVGAEDKRVIERYLLTLEDNYINKSRNYSKACRMGSDIFYLPKSQFTSFYVISNIYRKFNVFLEMATPMILSGLAPANDSEIINGKYTWDIGFNFDTTYYDIRVFFHPIKISHMQSGDFNKKYCNTFIREKLENDLKL